MKTLLCSAALSLLFVQGLHAQSGIAIIPKPQEINRGAGQFLLNPQTTLSFKNCDAKDVSLFVEQLRKVTHYPLNIKKQASNSIEFRLDSKLTTPNDEGYQLEVSNRGVVVTAKSSHGLFNATQSLRQLLPTAFEGSNPTKEISWNIPAVKIKDYPRYHWRGYMKDVSRTFFDVKTVKKYLDVMALYKMNTFHWHLTDDQGWRIEIKKYPKLTMEDATVFHRTEKQPAGNFTFNLSPNRPFDKIAKK